MLAPTLSSGTVLKTRRPRLALLRDFHEENWPSMDLTAEMLQAALVDRHSERFQVAEFCPRFRRPFGRAVLSARLPILPRGERLLNRLWSYPRALRGQVHRYDFFHVCDHSYAHLVHRLPAERTGVFCHDLDAFACLLGRERRWRPSWFRALARYTLQGLQKAALVFCSNEEMRRRLIERGLVDPVRLICAPYGVSSEFRPQDFDAPADADRLSRECDSPYLLHVGSGISRKRIDLLLEIFARVRRGHPRLRLLQVGGEWTAGQRAQLRRLHLEDAVVQRRGLTRRQLANVYRRARLVLLPSASEGFGLPVIEALACGTLVVATDLPILREVGGPACVYCPAGDASVWSEQVTAILRGGAAPSRSTRLSWAQRYSWAAHAETIADAYQRLI